MTEWIHLFAAHRVLSARNDEIIQGVLHPELDAAHPAVRAMLQQWPGQRSVHRAAEATELTLVRPLGPRRRERWWLHALLLLLTLATTTLAGAAFLGREPLRLAVFGEAWLPLPVGVVAGEALPGLWFSLPLLGVLLAHELGHYLTARRYRMDVSPPYFIPAPHGLNVIGTFGAFIRLRSPVVDRAVLLDVGAAGPLVSFVLSLPLLVVGLSSSELLPAVQGTTRFAVLLGEQPLWLGESLLLRALAALLLPPEAVALLHPLAFAGWLGLFVTTLNLFPLSQLDGGHILYALLGRWQRPVALGFLVVLLVLGMPWLGGWWGWWLWAGLVLVLGRGRVAHPAVLEPRPAVGGARRWVGWACVVIFVLTFVPLPIRL